MSSHDHTISTNFSHQQLIELIDSRIRFRTGIGYDVHAFADDRPLILGGVEIEHRRGLAGHSDADVITHAAMDAILGACGCADIGTFFPNTDPAFHNVNSLKLATQVLEIITQRGYELHNLDIMVIAQEPILKPHIPMMKKNLAQAFALTIEQIGLKATTNEEMGWIGRGEGIATIASALVRSVNF